ncbi:MULTISPECIES: IscS subfamily cysteine desulfurase [Bacillus]|uniref:IscS subfamily cysteine desulfurase n=1 Tax=Bacillus TaxID=1386 RepID=UPI00025B33E4|nr:MULTISPECIES: IscS subfamily cysteine desulfurase [Bacillus]EIF14102.1 desulfurase involved in iron-sulfur clusters for NAD biosynthesis [Bacillus sp. 5B6]MEC0953846.1 IscS subfamily cysteine desulfurase [Bacillus velezensis]MED3705558.1 IscS subfamily cysteine desulfurase [Bacillus velezensis]QGI73114.1 aminotransferase class V-fold PLP-dependent enzyme [Bacillus velezensis]QNE10662.1 IscS subfamily cysteine desulfurase [Bacillus velezensis]
MIYLDYAAGAPLSKEAAKVFQHLSTEVYGNASSLHDAGGRAADVLEYCRHSAGKLIGGAADGIYFTSGGTEANILAVQSLLHGLPDHKKHFITTAMEHHSIHNAAAFLADRGIDVTIIYPDENGLITEDILAAHIRPDTGLVSIQHANSETGLIQPVNRLAAFLHQRNILLHCDCVQSFGKLPIDADQAGIDALSVSGHKVYGPKGTGAVYIRPGVSWNPVYPHTVHENGFRPGTVNVPAIGAFTAAAEYAVNHMEEHREHADRLRNYLYDQIRRQGLPISFSEEEIGGECLPHIVGCFFHSFEGQYIMLECNRNDICISTGSACSAGSHAPSSAMKALRKTEREARQFFRISFGNETTCEQLDMLIHTFTALWEQKKGESAI